MRSIAEESTIRSTANGRGAESSPQLPCQHEDEEHHAHAETILRYIQAGELGQKGQGSGNNLPKDSSSPDVRDVEAQSSQTAQTTIPVGQYRGYWQERACHPFDD